MIMATCVACGTPRIADEVRCRKCSARWPSGDVTTGEALPVLSLEDDSHPSELQVDIRTTLEYAAVPRASDALVNVLVDITASGPPIVPADADAVAHVILLLDVSASMNHPDKYPVLTEALSGMLHELASPRSANVILSVVLFAWGSEALFRDVPAATLVPRDVLARIDASPLRFGRYTDTSGALKIAARIAADQLRTNRHLPTRIYLLTDGKPQDVPRAREAITRLATMPVDVDALAFGADADVGLLKELVSGGRGGTVKLVRSETLSDAFDRIAEVAQRVVGNRTIVEFELSRGVVADAAYRYRPGRHRFGDEALLGDRSFRTDLGAFESGRTYSLLFAVRLPETAGSSTDIGRIAVSIPGADRTRTFHAAVQIPRTADRELPEPDGGVRAARDVLAALSSDDVGTQLLALKVRRELYVQERRDPRVIEVIDKAIEALETAGSLAALSELERATLQSHTCTAGGSRLPAARKEPAAG